MQPIISNQQDFNKHYWKYYLSLEHDFLNTEPYVSIDSHNFHSFSIEYLKLYQAICSEIDVVAKCFCKIMDSNFSGKTIPHYCKTILDNYPLFSDTTISAKNYDLTFQPWKGWSYNIEPDGTTKSTNPDWWTKYNKIKHERTTFNTSSGMQYYEFANQEYVLNSLGGLFIVNMFIYRSIALKNVPNTDEIFPNTESVLFQMTDWIRPALKWGNLLQK